MQLWQHGIPEHFRLLCAKIIHSLPSGFPDTIITDYLNDILRRIYVNAKRFHLDFCFYDYCVEKLA